MRTRKPECQRRNQHPWGERGRNQYRPSQRHGYQGRSSGRPGNQRTHNQCGRNQYGRSQYGRNQRERNQRERNQRARD